MGFTSHDDLINQISTNGKYGSIQGFKTIVTAQVAGTWSDLAVLNGYPVAQPYTGTSLTYYANDETQPGAIYHGGNVASATKHLLSLGGTAVAAAGPPWMLMLVDEVGYIPLDYNAINSTSQRTVTMTALGSGARYPNGQGLRCYFSTRTAPTAGGPNLSEFTYLNPSGASKTCPVTVNFAATPVQCQVPHSGNASNRYGPFIPLAAGDTGISRIVTFTLSGGTAYTGTGAMAIHLVKPLATIPIPASGVYSVIDFVNMLPSLPRIPDGAFLKFLLFNTGATAASTPVFFSLDYAYGG